MALKYFPDAGGDTLLTRIMDDFNIPPDLPPEVFTDLMKFPFRNDDVLICSYPKAGCHWVWEIARMLLEGTVQVKLQEKEDLMIEWKTPEFMEQFPSPRVLNTHVLLRHLNPALLQKKIKIIMVLRNPKDVAVSFYNHHKKLPEYEYTGEFKNYLSLYLKGEVDYGSVFDYMRDWEREIAAHSEHPILVLHYENMKENLLREVKKIASFLEKSYDDALYEQVADKCTFNKMKARKGGVYETVPELGGSNAFYRKGEVGDWKNWFTVTQSEWCDRIHADKMAGSKIRFRYSLRGTPEANNNRSETNNNVGGL